MGRCRSTLRRTPPLSSRRRSSTDRQNQIRLRVAGKLAALVELLHRRIGHYSGVLCDRFAALFEYRHHLVIDAVFLYRASAVD